MDELLTLLKEEIRVSECGIHGEYRVENIFELNPMCPRCDYENYCSEWDDLREGEYYEL